MTQEELGVALGVKKAAVQKIESGRTSIGVDKLKIICEAFRVMPAHILYGTFPALWEKVYGVKAVEDIPLAEDLRMIARLESLAEARFGPRGMSLLNDVNTLNDEGLDRAIAYVGDLVRIEDYRKSEEPSS